jgi:Holliday junction resolvase RusA-like endonuclease
VSILRFTVPGRAAPGGSKKGFAFHRANGKLGVQLVDANAKAKPWKAIVAACALSARTSPALLEGPLMFTLRFIRARPVGHYGKKGLRSSAPPYPTTRPDVLKLARAVEDALTGIVWRDDAQIVSEHLTKEFGEPERVEVEIQELD